MIFLPRIAWLVWPLIALPTRAQFNDTFKFTVDSLDGMVDVDGASEWWGGRPFTLENATGYRTSDGSGGSSGCAFVGVGFEVQGFARWKNANRKVNQSDALSVNPVIGRLLKPTASLAGPGAELKGIVRDTPDLMSGSGLNLSAYELRWTYSPEADFEFHNLTIVIPVRTQAPSMEELESQATFVPAVVPDERINPSISFAFSQKMDEFHMLQKPLRLRDVYRARLLRRDVSYENDEDYVLLKNNTELSYLAPANTTLIRVYGRVGTMNQSVKGSHCYADLDPRPSWFKPGEFPIAAEEKAVDAHNRTLFMLPIDPAIRTTVKVGSLDLDTTCFVSGFSIYPFHYNYTLANLANIHTASSSSQRSRIATNKTGIIVGVVVGLVGALVVAGFVLWLVRRRQRRKRDKREVAVQPYGVSEKDLYRTASWAPHNTRTWPDELGGGVENGPGTEVGAHEDDGEEDVEYLPPQYREWQPGSGIDVEQALSGPSSDTGPAAMNRQSALSAQERSSELKEAYLRALGTNLSSSGTSSLTEPSLKQNHERGFEKPESSMKELTLKQDYERLFKST